MFKLYPCFHLSLLTLVLLLSGVNIANAQHTNIMMGNLRNPNEPSIAIDPKNPQHLIAAANIDNYFISKDGGYTWEQSRIFSSTLGVWGDPCVVVDTLGNYYFFHLSNPPGAAWIDRIVCQKSVNRGATWNQGSGIGFVSGKNQDKEWAVVDRKFNRLYTTWTQFDEYGSLNPADSSIIRFSRSDDMGETWTEPVRLNRVAGDCMDSDNTVQGVVPAIGPEGEIYVSWSGPEGLLFDRSLDGGITWMDEDVFVSDLPGGWDFDIPGISRANGFPITCCDISAGEFRGNIYINWSDQRSGTDDTDVWLSRSTDGGDTWTAPMRVNDDPPGKQQFFTWMALDQVTGYLWFVYYDRRNHDDWQTDVYCAVSQDGGESFINFKVSESPFMPSPGVFFGDYNNIVAHNNIVRPVWTRLHNDELSIYTAIVDATVVSAPSTIPAGPKAEMSVQPNPFSHSATITFKLHQPSLVSLQVRDVTGRVVLNHLQNQWMDSGKYVEKIDVNKIQLTAGVYLVELTINGQRQAFKLIHSP